MAPSNRAAWGPGTFAAPGSAAPPSSDMSDAEACLYANLQILGLDAVKVQEKLGVDVWPGMFRKPNTKAMEVVMHLLFTKLRPERSKRDFATTWPVYDTAQSREFKRVVQGLLEELERDGHLPVNASRSSTIATCAGERFTAMVWKLSSHVVQSVYARDFPNEAATGRALRAPFPLIDPTQAALHAPALLRVSRAQLTLERRKFVEHAASIKPLHGQWRCAAEELTREYRSLQAQRAVIEQELRELEGSAVGSGTDTAGDQLAAVERTDGVQRAEGMWESLSRYVAAADGGSEALRDAVENRAHRYLVDGAALHPHQQRGGWERPGEGAGTGGGQGQEQGAGHSPGQGTVAAQGLLPGAAAVSAVAPAAAAVELRDLVGHLLRSAREAVGEVAALGDAGGEGPPPLLSPAAASSPSPGGSPPPGGPGGGGVVGHEQQLGRLVGRHRDNVDALHALSASLSAAVADVEGSVGELRAAAGAVDAAAARASRPGAAAVAAAAAAGGGWDAPMPADGTPLTGDGVGRLGMVPPTPAAGMMLRAGGSEVRAGRRPFFGAGPLSSARKAAAASHLPPPQQQHVEPGMPKASWGAGGAPSLPGTGTAGDASVLRRLENSVRRAASSAADAALARGVLPMPLDDAGGAMALDSEEAMAAPRRLTFDLVGEGEGEGEGEDENAPPQPAGDSQHLFYPLPPGGARNDPLSPPVPGGLLLDESFDLLAPGMGSPFMTPSGRAL